MGGFTTGGLNFDAKRRRESHEPLDLFYAHIGGMDAFAKGLLVADKILADKAFSKIVDDRYATWKSPLGKEILAGKSSLDKLTAHTLKAGEPTLQSGRQELLEIHFNDLLLGL
jgi:xylose isomerase